METGLFLVILSAMCFGGGQVLIRRGTHQAEESFTAATISVIVGTLLFIVVLPLSGDWIRLCSLSWQGFSLLAGAGITNFVAGRYLAFTAIRLIGANKGGAIAKANILFGVISGIVFLHEPVTALLILGAIGIMAGVILVSFEGEGKDFFTVPAWKMKGVIFALVAALFTATSSILVKQAMNEVGSPYAATFVSYIAAFFFMASILLFGKRQRDQLFQISRYNLIVLTAAAVFALAAHILRYAALIYSPVSAVQPIMGTSVLFVFFFSLMVNRRIDVFTWRVFVGILIIVVGTFLICL